MKAVGIVVEYNPFHNGHLYHLHETKRQTGADCVIAVMSGNFLQRGEPAIVSKWARTRMALAAGVDIIVELPYMFAVQAAKEFAAGAVSLLAALHCDCICFGSESGDIHHFTEAVKALAKQEDKYNTYLKKALQTGVSYPKASALAFQQLQIENLDLTKPNNILGFYYVKSIMEEHKQITPHTIKRIAAGYHDQTISDQSIASATSLRNALNYSIEHLEKIAPYIPESTKNMLYEYYSTYRLFHQWNDYFSLLKYRILTMDINEMREIADMDEGLEYRFKNAAIEAKNFVELIDMVKTKRYTWTRLQRTCTHILTNFTKQQKESNKKATYIRLLGMSETGRSYLKAVKKQLSLPIISKVSLLEDYPIYKQEKKAAFAYISVLPEPLRTKACKEEYTTPPIGTWG
ncbi:putative nucleotidyltransferase [Anoxybacillus calidus]|uniref:tRNA(Met) cytidine acetate ligase n=1 Tax=[Anoxybacillus] calidus TaxID=575178 RepID=A0A7V9YYC5_9BACL|nr:nucleotidyltransferase [Anoxybacillus calidus]MBA2870697.1 putative nucleotidyltransferase [Anoxybacillus calidus]